MPHAKLSLRHLENTPDMSFGIVAASLGGLALGALVNWLATVLPARRAAQMDAGTPAETPAPAGRPVARIVAVEIVLGALAGYLWWRFGASVMFGVLLFYVTVFTLIAVIDIEHRLVLNVVMLPAFVVALLEVFLSGRREPVEALAGYAVAQIVVMGIYLMGHVYLNAVNARRGEPVTEVAFGFGDVTLATFCGLIIGYPGVIVMLVLMVLFGGLFALLYVLGRMLFAKGYRAHTPLPYGPSIILAAMVLLVWSKELARQLGGG